MARADEPAFPSPRERGEDHPGLTIREWYAGQAMKGLLAGNHFLIDSNDAVNEQKLAAVAGSIADAMLAQAEKKGGEK